MALFRRGKKKQGAEGSTSSAGSEAGGPAGTKGAEGRTSTADGPRVGIVAGVLSSPEGGRAEGESPFADVVTRRFGPRPDADPSVGPASASDATTRAAESSEPGPGAGADTPSESGASVSPVSPVSPVSSVSPGSADAHASRAQISDATGRDHLRPVAPLFQDQPATPALEVDPMAQIGRATTITGNIVAEEDLEIHGTVEGSVRLADHTVTVGEEGHVKASLDARTVLVQGRVTGDVVASDLVELRAGGVIGGDVKAPRVIMHDGAILVGALDMSASLPRSAETADRTPERSSAPETAAAPSTERPHLKTVERLEQPGATRADGDGA